MATMTTRVYGLTTEDAVRAFREGRLEDLPRSNRWRYMLEAHSQGQHETHEEAFERLCPICRQAPARDAN